MEQIFERVAGLDVHRDSVSVCARVPGARREVVAHTARYATTTTGLAGLANWLASEAVTVVGIGSDRRLLEALLCATRRSLTVGR